LTHPTLQCLAPGFPPSPPPSLLTKMWILHFPPPLNAESIPSPPLSPGGFKLPKGLTPTPFSLEGPISQSTEDANLPPPPPVPHRNSQHRNRQLLPPPKQDGNPPPPFSPFFLSHLSCVNSQPVPPVTFFPSPLGFGPKSCAKAGSFFFFFSLPVQDPNGGCTRVFSAICKLTVFVFPFVPLFPLPLCYWYTAATQTGPIRMALNFPPPSPFFAIKLVNLSGQILFFFFPFLRNFVLGPIH